MSDPKEKEKPKKFLLPSSLKHMQQHYRNQTESFVKNLGKPQQEPTHAKKQQKHHSLFKLNPSSSALVSEVPVDTLRKRSKSQKLQSLHNEPKESFFLLDHYKETNEKHIMEKKPILKNYKIDIRQMVTGENKYGGNQESQREEEPEKYEIVRPSQPHRIANKEQQGIFQTTIFQTPILPCFSTDVSHKRLPETSKTVQEGEGLWKVGKMKVKGKRCELIIGQFFFEGEQVSGEGRAGLLSEGSLHSLPNWKDMWILQPHQSLFTND